MNIGLRSTIFRYSPVRIQDFQQQVHMVDHMDNSGRVGGQHVQPCVALSWGRESHWWYPQYTRYKIHWSSQWKGPIVVFKTKLRRECVRRISHRRWYGSLTFVEAWYIKFKLHMDELREGMVNSYSRAPGGSPLSPPWRLQSPFSTSFCVRHGSRAPDPQLQPEYEKVFLMWPSSPEWYWSAL